MSAIAPPRPETRQAHAIPGSDRPLRTGAIRLGAVDPGQIVAITIRVRSRRDVPPPPVPWVAGMSAPLSHEAFAAQYGASDADLQAVAAFASANGLAVVSSDAARRAVGLTGTARQIGTAFGIELAHYRHEGTRHRGFEGPVLIPVELVGIVEHVVGLDDRPLARPLFRTTAANIEPMAGGTSGLTPSQVASLYKFPTGSAAGQAIGLLEFGGGYHTSDIQTYFQTIAKVAVPTVTFVSVDGAPNGLPGQLVAAGSRLHSYYGVDTSQHVNTIGTDGHVHELYAEPGSEWLDNDLTVVAGAPLPAAGTAVTSFWGTDSSQHVHYIGIDGHVHELYIEVGAPWKHNDLTVTSKGVLPRAGSPLAAYWQVDSSQHIDFVGANGHIYELYIAPGKAWECNDLTAAAKTNVTVASGSMLAGYYGTDTSQHINFIGTDGHVHELYANKGAGWAINDLTAASKAPPAAAGTALSSYWQADSSQHVHFIGTNGHVYELYLATGKPWVCNDLTVNAKAPVSAAAGSALDSYFGKDTSQHINFIGTDGHVHELYANVGAGWAHNDLTAASNGPAPVAGSPLCGYMQADSGQHVNFVDGSGHVRELYLATGKPWVCNDLTVTNPDVETMLDITVAAAAAPGAHIVVYAAPNNEKGWVDALSTAIHDTANKPSVLSISWGGDEGGWGNAVGSMSSVIAEAGPLGVTVFASSGDGGSESPAAVEYPASDPNVTGCGGTTVENVAGSTFAQVAWGGSGGGVSNSFPLPSWQGKAGVPKSINPAGHVGRGVPDISGNGDPNSGYTLVLNGQQVGLIGGTSAVAPLYAGLVALLNAQLGRRVGSLNPTLYGLGEGSVFDDVTSGTNTGYKAGTGWDAVTGLGSINGTALAAALKAK